MVRAREGVRLGKREPKVQSPSRRPGNMQRTCGEAGQDIKVHDDDDERRDIASRMVRLMRVWTKTGTRGARNRCGGGHVTAMERGNETGGRMKNEEK